MPMDPHPTAFGAFKPLNHVVISFPTAGAMSQALERIHDDQFEDAQVFQYTPAQMQSQAEYDVAHATSMADLGQDLNLVREQLHLAKLGHSFLVVYAPKASQVEILTQIAMEFGASRAQKYGLLLIEELIPLNESTTQRPESPESGLDPVTR